MMDKPSNVIRKEAIVGNISGLPPLVCDLTVNGKIDVVLCSHDGVVSFLYNVDYDKEYEEVIEYVYGPLYATPVLCSRRNNSPLVKFTS